MGHRRIPGLLQQLRNLLELVLHQLLQRPVYKYIHMYKGNYYKKEIV